MMKKMLTVAAAALALSACGSDAPTVEDVSTPSKSSLPTSPAIQDIALEGAWDSMDASQKDDLCFLFVMDTEDFLFMMDPESMNLTDEKVTDFFAIKCL